MEENPFVIADRGKSLNNKRKLKKCNPYIYLQMTIFIITVLNRILSK